ncbi:MAG: hypothetical protein V4687_04515 [Bacteroidota bacterium]
MKKAIAETQEYNLGGDLLETVEIYLFASSERKRLRWRRFEKTKR